MRAEAERRGWPGIAVLGRGGGTYDRHGDLMYLCGHYQAYVHLSDRPPFWTGRSYALLAVPVEGEPVLLCSAPEVDPEVAVGDVRITTDFPKDARGVLDALGGGGFSGFDVAPVTLARALDLGRFEAAEGMIEGLRRRKSEAEQLLLRHACGVGTRAVEALMNTAQPAATEGEAVSAAGNVFLSEGAQLYTVTLAAGDRVESFTGRPFPGYRPERRFAAGELARLDLVIVYEGYYCDFGRSWVVGGGGESEAGATLIAGIRSGLEGAVAAAVPGVTAGQIARAGRAALPPAVELSYPPHWGHGLGMGWEGPWLLADSEEPIEPGFALAIEVAGRTADLVASGEYDVLVTGSGPEILTPAAWP